MILNINFAFAHEPVFGLGPETIYKGGIGIETEIEYEKGESEKEISLHEEIIYGFKENISLTVSFPFIFEKKEEDSKSSGFGDITFRGKFRLYKKDYFGAQDKVSFIYGIKFPTGNEDKLPPIGTGSFTHTLGLAAGHESRKLYYFGALRWLNNFGEKDNAKEKGDMFLYDIAFGLRPVLKEYYESDLVFLFEISGEHIRKDKISSVTDDDSGGDILYLGPTFFWSYRNLMIKGGVQVPAYQSLNGSQEKNILRIIFATETHF